MEVFRRCCEVAIDGFIMGALKTKTKMNESTKFVLLVGIFVVVLAPCHSVEAGVQLAGPSKSWCPRASTVDSSNMVVSYDLCNCSTAQLVGEPGVFGSRNISRCIGQLIGKGLGVYNVTSGSDSPAIQILYLDNNDLTSISAVDFTNVPNLLVLSLRRNRIASIATGAFSMQSGLNVLYLSDNRLTSINSAAFAQLQSLTHLYLSDNQISILPGKGFATLTKLKWMLIDANRLSAISPDAFKGLSSLQRFNGNDNRISGDFNINVFNSSSVFSDLFLSQNRITRIVLGGYPHADNIGLLHVDGNLLTSLPQALTQVYADGVSYVLADNPWACVCNAEFLSIDSLVTAFRVQNVTCNSPSTHRGQLVSSLNIAKGRQTNCGCRLNCSSLGCDPVTTSCNCPDGYTGTSCTQCAGGYYNLTANSTSTCVACSCDQIGSNGTCSAETGQCSCRTDFKGRTCNTCRTFFYRKTATSCFPCQCYAFGTQQCNQLNGSCTCKPGYVGSECRSCAGDYRRSIIPLGEKLFSCTACSCNTRGSNSTSCAANGNCTCQVGTTGKTCDQCVDGYYAKSSFLQPNAVTATQSLTRTRQCVLQARMGALCQECCCNPVSSMNSSCSPATGQCHCYPGYSGVTCDSCAAGYTPVVTQNGWDCMANARLPARCPQIYDPFLEVYWPATETGVTSTLKCPSGYAGNMTRRCTALGVWGKPFIDDCVSSQFVTINTMISSLNTSLMPDILHNSALATLSNLATATGQGSSSLDYLVPGDIQVATTGLSILASSSFFAPENVTQEAYISDYVRIVSNLLDDRNVESWSLTSNGSSTTLLQATSNFAYQSAIAAAYNTSTKSETVVSSPNAALKISVRSTTDPQDIVFPDYSDPLLASFNQASTEQVSNIRVPAEVLAKVGAKAGMAAVPVANVIYNNLNNILPSEREERNLSDSDSESTSRQVNTVLITTRIGVAGAEMENFEADPITITLLHTNTSIINDPECVFWNFSRTDFSGYLGAWDDSGLTRVSTDDATTGVTRCQSTHLTSFAVLVSPTGDTSHAKPLSYITYIGCAISLGCLTAMAVVLITLRKAPRSGSSARQHQNMIHLNLALALAFGQITFIAGIKQTQSRVGCGIVAGLLHYFFTVAFTWMAVEGYHLYLMTVHVFKARENKLKIYFITSWGVPLINVGISAGIRYQDYGTADFLSAALLVCANSCWLSTRNGTIWAFLGPMCAVLLANFAILINTIRVLNKRTKDGEPTKAIKAGVRASLMLMPLLGLTWVFGLFAVNESTVLFAYLFTIFNSLQGFFLFMVHIVLNSSVRESYGTAVRKSTLFSLTSRSSISPERPMQATKSTQNLIYTTDGSRADKHSINSIPPDSESQLTASTEMLSSKAT